MSQFCKECFEQRKPKCECSLEKLSSDDKKKAIKMYEDDNDKLNFTQEIECSEDSFSISQDKQESFDDIC